MSLRYKKFGAPCVRVLLVASKQYLLPDLVWGCSVAGFASNTLLLDDVVDEAGLLAQLRQAVDSFRPDFVLTLNNLGFDREGVILDFFHRAELPALSWFVDNPFLFLADYQGLASPYLTLAVWDKDQLAPLARAGFTAFYLPLAANLGRAQHMAQTFVRQTGFVGNSMHRAVQNSLRPFPPQMSEQLEPAAHAFIRSSQRDITGFLHTCFPRLFALRQKLGDRQTAFDALFYWLSTQTYRISCVRQLFPFMPVIAGDPFWQELLGEPQKWEYHPPPGYYAGLFSFYQQTALNLNTSSMQMKGAVNQRVFDVPLAGSFVLTDRRDQLLELFEPQLEVICYNEPEEIGDLARFYLDRSDLRQAVCQRARDRIFRQHGYHHRLLVAADKMRELYA